MNEVITPQALPDGSQLNPAGGDGAAQTGGISLAQLSEVLGKEFPDVETALKSVKDTYSYVGSQAEYREKIGALATTLGTDEAGVISTIDTLMAEINNNNAGDDNNPPAPVVPQGDYVTKEDMFFMNNKELSDLRDVLTPIKNSSEETRAMAWDQFVATDLAKKVIEPVTGYREIQSQRSVLDSNPRLGSAVDVLTKSEQALQASREAEARGDVAGAGQAMHAAREGAVKSVIDAYGLAE